MMRSTSRLRRRGRGQRWTSIVLVLLLAVPLAIALLHEGFPAADVEMSSRDVWVTNSKDERAGRLNAQISEIDASVSLDSAELDVVQDGADVFVHDIGGGTIGRVDPMYTDLRERIAVPAGAAIAYGGDTLAILDRATGKLWLLDASQPLTFDANGGEPVLTLGPNAQVVVTERGAALAYAPGTGDLFRIPSLGAEPVSVQLGDGGAGGKDAELTAVGERAAVLDRDGNRVLLEDEIVVGLDAVGVRIQAPGPEDERVVVATASDFIEVPLTGEAPIHVGWAGAAGTATDELAVARPVVVEGCRYGAWASTDEIVTACPGADPVVTPLPSRDEAGELVFRVNRDIVALNDLSSGNVWMPQDNLRFVENWEDTVPPEDQEGGDGEQEATEQSFEDTLAERTDQNHPPELVDDEFGARPASTAYLPVLDNDTDPDGDLITITEVTDGIPASVGTLRVIDDGRALQLDAVEGASGEFTVTYTGTDGRPNGVAQARLTIRIVPAAEENRGPELRHRATVTVEAGQLVRYNVLPDWQDPEGDPVYLLSAIAPGGANVTTAPDGVITFESLGAELGDRLVSYKVSDGATTTTGELTVQVAAPGSLAPVATPDFARGWLGSLVVAEPLVNDLSPSGSALQIIEVVELDAGARAKFNPDLATVSLEATVPGTYYVQYTVKGGLADTQGIIRFEVVDPATADGAMVAVRDTAFLRPGQPASVSPLLNDEAGSASVLAVQSVTTTDEALIAGLAIELIDNATVRVSAQSGLTAPIELPYTVSDGKQTAEGTIVVLPVEPAVEHHPPVALDDARSVRVGDYATVDVLANDIHPDGTPMTIEPRLVDLQIADGYAFVADGKVRFQAPSEPGTYSLGYQVTDEYGEQGGARITFDVGGMDEASNRPPAPTDEVARVFEGSTIRVNVPLSGVDADGDSVTLEGVSALPSLGSIREQDETSFVYEAFPGSAGTDEVKYEVVDTYGARGVGTIRIGVVPRPAETAPPVAVDDLLDAQPGRIVSVPVLENDSDPNGYPVEIVDDVSEIDPALEPQIDGGAIILHVPQDADFFSVPYSITNDHGGIDSAYIHVTVTPDAPVPAPSAIDHVVAASAFDGVDHVDVPLREGAWNPSGRTGELIPAAVGVNAGSAEVTEDGSLRVRPSDRRQVFAYQLEDEATGQTAAAFVLVPALQVTEESKRQSPYLRTDLPPQLTNVDTSLRWNVNDLVTAPSGLRVHVIDAPSAWAEQGDGSAVVVDDETIQFTPKPGFRGPASVTFLVSDAQGADDEALAGIATIRVPITVGDPNMYDVAPTFVTPQMTVAVGTSQTLDLASATGHPNPAVIPQVQFSGLTGGAEGVTASLSGSTLTVAAERQTRVGEVLRLGVTYAFRDFVQTGTVNVTITSSPLPPPRAVDDEAAGVRNVAVTVDVTGNDFNPYPDAPLVIREAREVSATSTGAQISVSGGQITVRPSETFIGEVTVQYTVIDDTGDQSRTARGHLRVRFRDVPDAPRQVTATTTGDGSVVVQWDSPQSNGEPILDYEVYLESSNGSVVRPAGAIAGNTTTFTTAQGVIKGDTYTATVRARNLIGTGGAARSNSVKPITRPGAPRNVAVTDSFTRPGQNFGLLLVSWDPPQDTGGEISQYIVTIVSPRGATDLNGNPAVYVSGSQTSVNVQLRADGSGTTYGFTVTAKNANGEQVSEVASGTITRMIEPSIALVPGGDYGQVHDAKAGYDRLRHFAFYGSDFVNTRDYTLRCIEGYRSNTFQEHTIAEVTVKGSYLNASSMIWPSELAECQSDQPGFRLEVYDPGYVSGEAVAVADRKGW